MFVFDRPMPGSHWAEWQGYLFQGQKFKRVQIFGIFLVAAGVAKAAWPTGAGSVLGQVEPYLISCVSKSTHKINPPVGRWRDPGG